MSHGRTQQLSKNSDSRNKLFSAKSKSAVQPIGNFPEFIKLVDDDVLGPIEDFIERETAKYYKPQVKIAFTATQDSNSGLSLFQRLKAKWSSNNNKSKKISAQTLPVLPSWLQTLTSLRTLLGQRRKEIANALIHKTREIDFMQELKGMEKLIADQRKSSKAPVSHDVLLCDCISALTGAIANMEHQQPEGKHLALPDQRRRHSTGF